MSRKIERSFTVSVAVERVWEAMTDPDELNRWYFPFRVADDGSTHTEIDGNERHAEVVEFGPPHRFTLRTSMAGTEQWPPVPAGARDMTVVLESTDAGTTVVVTHSGFGDGEEWEQVLEATSRGISETTADLVCYLETGVGVRRHSSRINSWHGIGVRERRAGLEVVSVEPGTYADRVGLAAGDLLVGLDGAAVFGLPELNFFVREHPAGTPAEASWVRDGGLMRATAELGPRPVRAPSLAG